MQGRVALRAHGVRRHPGVQQGGDSLRHAPHGGEMDRPQAAGVRRVEVHLRQARQRRRRQAGAQDGAGFKAGLPEKFRGSKR